MIEEILQDKRAEIAKLNATLLRNVRPSTRDFGYAVGAGRKETSLLVELKRRDPWEGEVRPDLDLVAQARALQELGVAGLVVATEARHWGGSRNDLIELDKQVQLPLLRHDFIIDELQLFESRRAGADAVLLRAGLLAADTLRAFSRTLASMHMTGVVLVHDRAELEVALQSEAPMLAISNRHPETGAIDIGTTLQLSPHVPASRSLLSLFGIRTREDVARLRGHADAIVLGTALLRASDPIGFLKELAADR